jgi:UDP-N-acetylmuramate--alanine ligase
MDYADIEESKLDLRDLPEGSTIHFVGIGGAGMSAIALVLLRMGYKVEGSDLKESSYVRRLRGMGAAVGLGHRAENLLDCEVVVRSSAIREDNPELLEAERRGITIVSRAQMLAAIMATRRGIAVAGTHGKTTTTALVACVLESGGLDPSYLVGGELRESGANAHYGAGEYIVAEADESDGSLLYLRPEVIVLTNIDWDHLDYFDSLEHTFRVFSRFLEVLPPDGTAVVCADDERARAAGENYRRRHGDVVFYGTGADVDYAFEVIGGDASGTDFLVRHGAGEVMRARTVLPGLHNVYNAVAAFAVGHRLSIPVSSIVKGIERCEGVRRRFEIVGEVDSIQVVDDYAHHPTEIEAVMDIAGRAGASRTVAVFQPHRYTRTKMLAGDFGKAFDGSELVIVADVYGAGEDPEPGVTGQLIADSILEHDPGRDVVYVEARAELARETVARLLPGDLVITIGAGDVTRCAREIIDLLLRGKDEGGL